MNSTASPTPLLVSSASRYSSHISTHVNYRSTTNRTRVTFHLEGLLVSIVPCMVTRFPPAHSGAIASPKPRGWGQPPWASGGRKGTFATSRFLHILLNLSL